MTTKTMISFGLYRNCNGYDGLKEKVVDGLSACIEFVIPGEEVCNEEIFLEYLRSIMRVTFGSGHGEYVLLSTAEWPVDNQVFPRRVEIDAKDIVSSTLSKIGRGNGSS